MMNIKPTHPFYDSLSASWKEGIPANMMIFIMDYYLIPYALFLGASSQQIGFLVAVPHLLGSLMQLTATRLVKTMGSRLRLLISGAILQATSLLGMALLSGLRSSHGTVYTIIFLSCVFRIIANFIGTAWGSLVSEYLSPSERGRYLGWRSQVVSIAGVLALACSGLWLFWAEKKSLTFGFLVLFSAAALCRFLSACFFTKMADLPYREKKEDSFTFWMFLRRFRKSNFVKFVLYVASITFATQLAAPYFNVYMLRDLKMNYAVYTAIDLAAVVSGLISFPLWGKHADRVGNAKILKVTSLLIPWIPVLWILSSNWVYLFAVEVFSGFVWGGFNLCAANFIYDAVSPQKRIRCLGYFNLINGISIFLGATLGGFLSDKLPPLLGWRLLSLFALSGGMRFLAHFFLAGTFRETRTKIEGISSLDLFFSVIGIRSMAGRNEELGNWAPSPKEPS